MVCFRWRSALADAQWLPNNMRHETGLSSFRTVCREGRTAVLDNRFAPTNEVVARIHARYADALWRLAEKEIGPPLRREISPSDVVQSAFASFCWRFRDGRFRIDHSGALWRLLVTITLNKIRRRGGTRKLISLDDLAQSLEPLNHDPSPLEAAALTDQIEFLLKGLPVRCGEVLGCRMRGYSIGETAELTGCSRWTVRRDLRRIAEQLSRLELLAPGDRQTLQNYLKEDYVTL
jgi:RNA polymerase sigma-70 factor (ECF subfamily)